MGGSINPFNRKSTKVRVPEFDTQNMMEDLLSTFTSVTEGGKDSQMGKALQGLIEADPLLQQNFLALQAFGGQALQGIEGLDSGLPEDVRRGVLENVRSTSAARGIIDSPGAALQEAAQLGLSTERFRQQRMGQLGQFIGMSQGGLQSLVSPGPQGLLSAGLERQAIAVGARGQSAQLGLQRELGYLDFAKEAGKAAAGGF